MQMTLQLVAFWALKTRCVLAEFVPDSPIFLCATVVVQNIDCLIDSEYLAGATLLTLFKSISGTPACIALSVHRFMGSRLSVSYLGRFSRSGMQRHS
eukprot:5459900-Amphidinium_carterae.1